MAGLIGPFLFAALRGSDLTVCQRTPQSRQIRSLVSLVRTLVPGKGFVKGTVDNRQVSVIRYLRAQSVDILPPSRSFAIHWRL